MTEQEAFDTMVVGLLKQGRKSTLGEIRTGPDAVPMCAYRGAGGCKCAAGFLIPDGDYSPSMEGKSVRDEPVSGFFSRAYGATVLKLAYDLQGAHDNAPPPDEGREEFRDYISWECKIIAERYGLSTAAMDAALAEIARSGVPASGTI